MIFNPTMPQSGGGKTIPLTIENKSYYTQIVEYVSNEAGSPTTITVPGLKTIVEEVPVGTLLRNVIHIGEGSKFFVAYVSQASGGQDSVYSLVGPFTMIFDKI